MRALAVEELGFVSGGENNRPWNPYENFKDVVPSQDFLRYEQFINLQLRAAGLDYWGNPASGSSSYAPSANNPIGSVTAGNNAAQVSGSYTTSNGSVVTGAITVPYDGSSVSATATYTTPSGTAVTGSVTPAGPRVAITIPF